MLQPLKYKRGISNITETMILVFKYWPCKKKKIKLGKESTILKTAKMKHHMISHQAIAIKDDFRQGLKVILPPLAILTFCLVLTCSFHVQG